MTAPSCVATPRQIANLPRRGASTQLPTRSTMGHLSATGQSSASAAGDEGPPIVSMFSSGFESPLAKLARSEWIFLWYYVTIAYRS